MAATPAQQRGPAPEPVPPLQNPAAGGHGAHASTARTLMHHQPCASSSHARTRSVSASPCGGKHVVQRYQFGPDRSPLPPRRRCRGTRRRATPKSASARCRAAWQPLAGVARHANSPTAALHVCGMLIQHLRSNSAARPLLSLPTQTPAHTYEARCTVCSGTGWARNASNGRRGHLHTCVACHGLGEGRGKASVVWHACWAHRSRPHARCRPRQARLDSACELSPA